MKKQGTTIEYTVMKAVRETIEKHCLFEAGNHIVLGLSGGPDSVCLFHVLLQMAGEKKLTIHPVHLNHMFRPGAAEKDQAYVQNLCSAFASSPEYKGLVQVCRTFVVDCNALAEETGRTSEEAGRMARYDAFCEVAEELVKKGVAQEKIKIAVAQNANDQAETILFRLLRGTGTDGLAGISYEREERGFRVIRPLLDVYRSDIEAYCDEAGLNPVIDHTNKEAIYARNKIRLELLPYLEREYNENIAEGLVRLSNIAADDKEYLWREAAVAYGRLRISGKGDGGNVDREIVLDRDGLAALHRAIRHRVLMLAFNEAGLTQDVTAERLEAANKIILVKQGPKTVEFPRGYRLTVEQGQVKIGKQKKAAADERTKG
ncbi:MAG: tRNA lysidine(34) synthetase TilS [Lentihominibacter sp.]